MTLLDDCIKALGQSAYIAPKQETDTLFDELMRQFPFTNWGRIDWASVKHQFSIGEISEILPLLLENERRTSQSVFIIWDEATLPAIKSSLETFLAHIEDVTIVSFDTWIFCPTEKYVIEFYHEGEIRLGFNG